MHIPQRYRDRYDRLALAHPWMREMRDGTNGIDGETNGIAADVPLVDVVTILREADDGSLRMKAFAYDPHSLTKLADMIARDYVSRADYEDAAELCHGYAEDIATLKAKCDEWKTKCETREVAYKQADAERKRYSEQIDGLFAERDEWKAKAEQAERAMNKAAGKWARADARSAKRAAAVENLKANSDWGWSDLADFFKASGLMDDPYHTPYRELRDALIDLLEDDGLRSNDGVERSNDGATNLEWLFEHDREKLIAMASESCVCATCVYGWHVQESWQCADERWPVHCTEGNREWLMAPHDDAQSKTEPRLSQLFGILSDDCGQNADMSEKDADCVRNDGEMSEVGVSADGSDANDANATHDSREKLEEDVCVFLTHGYTVAGNESMRRAVVGWLDRQKAITERETIDRWDMKAALRIAELQGQVNKLTAECGECVYKQEFESTDDLVLERDELQSMVDYLESRHCEWSDPDSLGDPCMLRHDKMFDELRAERDELQSAYDGLVSIAGELCRACGFTMVDASGEAV